MRTIKKLTIVLGFLLVNVSIGQAKDYFLPVACDTINPIEAMMKMESFVHSETENGGSLRWFFFFKRKTVENGVTVDSTSGSGIFWATGDKFRWIHEGFIYADSVEEQTQDDRYNVIVNYQDSTVKVGPLIPMYKRIFEFDVFDTLLHQRLIDSISILPGSLSGFVKIRFDFKAESPFSFYEVTYDSANNLIRQVKYRIRNEVYLPGTADFSPPGDQNYMEYEITYGGHSVIASEPWRFDPDRFFTRREGQFILAPRYADFELINLYDQ